MMEASDGKSQLNTARTCVYCIRYWVSCSRGGVHLSIRISEYRWKIHTMASEELMAESQRRKLNESMKGFSNKEIEHYRKMFNQHDKDKDTLIDYEELKLAMEKLEFPQTHLTLKKMFREVDEDHDNKINFSEFLLILHKAAPVELQQDNGQCEVSVEEEGVKGAKSFFEEKINEQTQCIESEQEIRNEQEEKRKQQEEKKKRRADFKNTRKLFEN